MQDDTRSNATANDGFTMSPDQIFITDVGVGLRKDAFFYLALGHHIHDHKFDEISVRDLEKKLDPDDVMNPAILRGELWKTVPPRLWQYDDGNQFGPLPSQPGLGAKLNGVYYGDRRSRQAAERGIPSPSYPILKTDLRALKPRSSSSTSALQDSSPCQYRTRRRTQSLDGQSPFFSSINYQSDQETMSEANYDHYSQETQGEDRALQNLKIEPVGPDSAIDMKSWEGGSEKDDDTFEFKSNIEEIARRLLNTGLADDNSSVDSEREVQEWEDAGR